MKTKNVKVSICGNEIIGIGSWSLNLCGSISEAELESIIKETEYNQTYIRDYLNSIHNKEMLKGLQRIM